MDNPHSLKSLMGLLHESITTKSKKFLERYEMQRTTSPCSITMRMENSLLPLAPMELKQSMNTINKENS